MRLVEAALLAEIIEGFSADPQRCQGMGQRARAPFVAEFDQRIAMDFWAEVLAEVGAKAEDRAPAVVI